LPQCAARRRTVAAVFGPTMLLWFAVIGVLGARASRRAADHPSVLTAIDHGRALPCTRRATAAFFVLGSVVLV
jgi:K+ transporter